MIKGSKPLRASSKSIWRPNDDSWRSCFCCANPPKQSIFCLLLTENVLNKLCKCCIKVMLFYSKTKAVRNADSITMVAMFEYLSLSQNDFTSETNTREETTKAIILENRNLASMKNSNFASYTQDFSRWAIIQQTSVLQPQNIIADVVSSLVVKSFCDKEKYSSIATIVILSAFLTDFVLLKKHSFSTTCT